MIKLVAFDLDGTIGDTIPMCIQAFKKSVGPYMTNGEISKEAIVQTFGLNEEGMIRQIVVGDQWKQALQDFYLIYEEMHSICPEPLEGILELLADFRKLAIPVVLVTGKGAKSCMITLKQFKMEECFERISTGSADKNIKAESLRDLLAHYNLCANEVLYIGDALSDVDACREVGVRCLSAAWVISSEERARLEEHNPENVFSSIQSLRCFLEKVLLC